MERLGVLLVLASTLYTASSQTSVQSSGSALLSVGDKNVQLLCTVTDFDVYSQVVSWSKVDNAHPSKNKKLTTHISLVTDVDRYLIDSRRDGNDVIYTLTIKEIRTGDDGNYECAVLDSQKAIVAKSSEDLKVKQPIASLVLMVGSRAVMASNQPPKQTFELESFDEDLVIQCRVRGSNPEPMVKLSIGGEDITQQVLRQDQPNVQGDMFNSIRTYNTDLDSTARKTFDKSIVGQDIRCEGYMADDPTDVVSATAVVTVLEPPKVECSNVSASLGEREVRLTCVIESVKVPNNIVWFVNSDSPVFVKTDGVEIEGYTATTKDAGDNKIETTLEIAVFEDRHYDGLYTLQAQAPPNDLSHVVRVYHSESRGGVATVSGTTVLLFAMGTVSAVVTRTM